MSPTTLTLTAPPIVDDATRREFIGMIAAAGLLAACGDTSSSSGDDEKETRTVTADNGEIVVPKNPQRVVAAIGSFETDMVAVGIMPVLTTTFAGPWVELADSVTITDNIPPTAEELVNVDPDLIVGWNWVTEEPSYDEISAVAPYVGLGETEASAGPGFDGSQPTRSWDTLFLSVCEVVGRRAKGQELVDEFEAHLDSFRDRTPKHPGASIARIEFFEAATFSYRGLNEDTAELMRRMGLVPAGPEDNDSKASLERLSEIDADWLIVGVGGDMDASVFEEVSKTDVFQRIPAVAAGRVIQVDGTLWSGFGHLWARAVTDDIERLFF